MSGEGVERARGRRERGGGGGAALTASAVSVRRCRLSPRAPPPVPGMPRGGGAGANEFE